MQRYKAQFEETHADDLRSLVTCSIPEHLELSDVAQKYLNNRWRVTLSTYAYSDIVVHLEENQKDGGMAVLNILNRHMTLNVIERAKEDTSAIARLIARARGQKEEDLPADDEGIPGHNPGSANTEAAPGHGTLTRLKLGPLPMEQQLLEDVLGELAEKDEREPPRDGTRSLVDEFKDMIKVEDGDEQFSRDDLPMPPSRARDLLSEVLKVTENRNRYRFTSMPNGGIDISICMFTFHNAAEM